MTGPGDGSLVLGSKLSQSPGECHLIKSSNTASGFAALNADMSAITFVRSGNKKQGMY